MQSDFASVRRLLEEALTHVQGADDTSGKVREALELLIEAAVTAEYAPRKVLPFSAHQPNLDHSCSILAAGSGNCCRANQPD